VTTLTGATVTRESLTISGGTDTVAGADPEVRAGRPAEPDAVATLIARWRVAGATFVVVDERGRHTELAAGRLDLTCPSVLDTRWLHATLHRVGYAVLDACHVPRDARSLALGRALATVQRLRAQTGQPEWVLLEDAQDVLRLPDLPPHALNLADGGYALAARDGATLPAAVTGGAAFDVRVTQPSLELSVIPPVRDAVTSG
jgi:hypothetical protein